MNRSTASKYANILSVLGEAENLMLLEMLIEENDYVCVTEMAKATNLTERKVIGFCEKLQDLGLVSQDNRNGLTYYKFSNTSNARMLEVVWRKVF
jgi:DNA-binding IclR family transcriptional regulator